MVDLVQLGQVAPSYICEACPPGAGLWNGIRSHKIAKNCRIKPAEHLLHELRAVCEGHQDRFLWK